MDSLYNEMKRCELIDRYYNALHKLGPRQLVNFIIDEISLGDSETAIKEIEKHLNDISERETLVGYVFKHDGKQVEDIQEFVKMFDNNDDYFVDYDSTITYRRPSLSVPKNIAKKYEEKGFIRLTCVDGYFEIIQSQMDDLKVENNEGSKHIDCGPTAMGLTGSLKRCPWRDAIANGDQDGSEVQHRFSVVINEDDAEMPYVVNDNEDTKGSIAKLAYREAAFHFTNYLNYIDRQYNQNPVMVPNTPWRPNESEEDDEDS